VLDFTLKTYHRLLGALPPDRMQTVESHFRQPRPQTVLLRHDVDARPENALLFAEMQSKRGIQGTYYFRAFPPSYRPSIIEKIAAMGHEIGYHYENVCRVLKRMRGKRPPDENTLIDRAAEDFTETLSMFRRHFDVKTVVMHGNPLCPYDNRLIWRKYDYRELGILGEPSMDIDFNRFYYLTDTGRCWNGENVSVRDVVPTRNRMNVRTTFDIVDAIHNNTFPDRIMMTFHPQRWNDPVIDWFLELFMQRTKNLVKYAVVRKRNASRRRDFNLPDPEKNDTAPRFVSPENRPEGPVHPDRPCGRRR
jgi:hypothetical protein